MHISTKQIYTYIYIYICICMYVYTYICIYICIYHAIFGRGSRCAAPSEENSGGSRWRGGLPLGCGAVRETRDPNNDK